MALMLIRDWFSSNPPQTRRFTMSWHRRRRFKCSVHPWQQKHWQDQDFACCGIPLWSQLVSESYPTVFFLYWSSWNWILCSILSILWCICLNSFFSRIGILVYRSHMHALLTIACVCFFASCLHGHWCAWDCLCVSMCTLVHWINPATCNYLPFKTSSLSFSLQIAYVHACMCVCLRV